MKMRSDCKTLTEYRRDILRVPQGKIATAAGCTQAWISRIERGDMPAPWRREKIIRAYKLRGEQAETEFVRLVAGGKK